MLRLAKIEKPGGSGKASQSLPAPSAQTPPTRVRRKSAPSPVSGHKAMPEEGGDADEDDTGPKVLSEARQSVGMGGTIVYRSFRDYAIDVCVYICSCMHMS